MDERSSVSKVDALQGEVQATEQRAAAIHARAVKRALEARPRQSFERKSEAAREEELRTRVRLGLPMATQALQAFKEEMESEERPAGHLRRKLRGRIVEKASETQVKSEGEKRVVKRSRSG